MLRIQSDTDLLGIDKEKTFTASAIVKPAELLARVVNVLGNYDDQQRAERGDQGVHMFEDKEILASEKPSIWSIGNDAIVTNPPYYKRNRALSIAVPNYGKDSVSKANNDFTWTNGISPDKYIESIKRSPKLSLPTEELPAYPVRDTSQQTQNNLLSKIFRKSSSTENPTPSSTGSPIDRRKSRRGSFFPTRDNSQEKHYADNYKEKTKRGRHSIFPTFDFNQDEDEMAKAYMEKTRRGRHSIFPTFDFNLDDDDDSAKAYKEKTKRGRHSIFPTFDFSENDEDDLAKAYLEKTRRGRYSIFPTFDFDFSDEDDDNTAKAYKEKTKHGRHSIFPTFDFGGDEDETAKKYKESTKRGRRSIFPTFNFGETKNSTADSINEDEVKDYQNRTRKGRGSLFPSFGKSKENDNEDDIIPDDSEEVKAYQNKTKRGRLSLFPSFGKDRKSHSDDDPSGLAADIKKYQELTKRGRSSLFSGDIQNHDNISSELERYRNKTKRGRPSLFDPDVNIDKLSESEQVDALEQTSVADLLRALAVLECVAPNHSTDHSNSFADLITGTSSSSRLGARRRGSVRPDFVTPSIPAKIETDDLAGTRRRRVSVRAAAPQFTPTLQTVVAGAELQTTALSARENRMSMVAQPPPPYSETDGSAIKEESSQQKARRFSPAPGGPSFKSGPIPRLFSRIRKDSATSSVEEENPRRESLTDIVIENNKNQT